MIAPFDVFLIENTGKPKWLGCADTPRTAKPALAPVITEDGTTFIASDADLPAMLFEHAEQA